jgi:aldehyde:ferredoxin oxidoreductase
MIGGYAGKILRVDLTTEKTWDERLPEESVLRKFIGCWGLGLKILFDECPPGIAPWEPENPLIFMTGPLTGTPVPAATNATAISLNFETGYTAGRSHSHGSWGIYLKKAGYDGIIITGAAKEPVYLWIHDGEVEIRDAKRIWGHYTHKTEELVKEDIGVSEASVAAIGPAGENIVHGAIIENDKHHSFSHSGMGAVMGAKKLKAIATYGTGEIAIEDANRLKQVALEWTKSLLNCDMGKFWKIGGQNAKGRREVYEYDKRIGILSAKNFLTVSPPEWLQDIEEVCEITPKPCPGCPLACSYEVRIKKGPYQGYVFTPSGGGENMEGPASMVGIYDSARIYYLVELNDELGMEAGFIGCVMGLAIECYEKGLLTKEQTGGLELRWGDINVAEKLMKMVAYKDGWLGKILAMGAKRAAEIIGGDAPKFAVHIKGASMNHHDWRAAWGVLFGQIVGGGSGWPAPGVTTFTTEPDLGYTKFQDPLTPYNKPEAARKTGMLKFWNDSIGTCWNAKWGVPGVLKFTTEAINAATGWDITPDEALLIGERIMNLERVFNVYHGLTPECDFDIGPRILEPPQSGPAKGKSIAPYLRGMIMEYYRLMGWDEITGKPLKSTLKRLGLEEYIRYIWG